MSTQAIISKMMNDIHQNEMQVEKELAEANPSKYRNSRIREKGGYRYYSGKNGRGQHVRSCYSTHRNVAGYFLIWREVRKAFKQGKRKGWEWNRDQWDSTKFKDDAIRVCEQRRNQLPSRV